MTTLLMLAAAAGVMLWPSKKRGTLSLADLQLPELDDAPAAPAPAAPVTYQTSMMHLAAVRQRLVHTGDLNADVRSAFEILTLELLNGSER